MTLDLKPEIAAALKALAPAQGVCEDYLEQLVERELRLSRKIPHFRRAWHGSGKRAIVYCIWHRPLPLRVVDDAIRQVREERARHILGKHS